MVTHTMIASESRTVTLTDDEYRALRRAVLWSLNEAFLSAGSGNFTPADFATVFAFLDIPPQAGSAWASCELFRINNLPDSDDWEEADCTQWLEPRWASS